MASTSPLRAPRKLFGLAGPSATLTNDEFKQALNYTSPIFHATPRGVHTSHLAFRALPFEDPVSTFAASRPRKG